MVTLTKYDAVEFLDSEEAIMEYLSAAMEHGNEAHLRLCLADAARARAINQLANETGIDRDAIYNMLSGDAGPKAAKISPEAIAKVAKAFAVTASV